MALAPRASRNEGLLSARFGNEQGFLPSVLVRGNVEVYALPEFGGLPQEQIKPPEANGRLRQIDFGAGEAALRAAI